MDVGSLTFGVDTMDETLEQHVYLYTLFFVWACYVFKSVDQQFCVFLYQVELSQNCSPSTQCVHSNSPHTPPCSVVSNTASHRKVS